MKFTLYAVAQAVEQGVEQQPEVATRCVEERRDGLVPYGYDCNDFKFHVQGSGFRDPNDFYTHLQNAFDVIYEEREAGQPKMMTIGLHCQIIGRPGRYKALRDFVEYIAQKEGVWVATRTEIAEECSINGMWTALHTPVVNILGFVGQNGMPIDLSLVALSYYDRHLLA
ncbi:hypothetical protein EDB80DRAFT_898402 [Ilyonectria destructans]|nr:hypothetical protein EDB80DRAFT_898402 [Ilyonectria destructans]